MFGKKKNVVIEKKDDSKVRLTVMPEIFYGGKDPLIYSEQKVNKIEKKKTQEKQLPVKIVPPFSKKKVMVILIILIGLVAGGSGFYYFKKSKMSVDGVLIKIGLKEKPKTPAPIPPPPKLPASPPPTPTPPTPPPPTPPEPEPITNSKPARPLAFPRILLNDSPDLDKDSLTDLEEEIFNTDSGTWDTDIDGYNDGQEVFNLYNPTGFAPVKLVDSGLVREYANPTWKYRIYYPASWVEANVDATNDQILFSSINGDFMEVRVIKNDLGENFDAWFANNITGQSFTDLTLAQNRFGAEFRKRNDSLVAYFVGNKVVFVMTYQPRGEADNLPFRHIMQMMYNSFRLGETGLELPEQKVLPVTNL